MTDSKESKQYLLSSERYREPGEEEEMGLTEEITSKVSDEWAVHGSYCGEPMGPTVKLGPKQSMGMYDEKRESAPDIVYPSLSMKKIGSDIQSVIGKKKPMTIGDHLNKSFVTNKFRPIESVDKFVSSMSMDEGGLYSKTLDFTFQMSPNELQKCCGYGNQYVVSTSPKLAFTLGTYKKLTFEMDRKKSFEVLKKVYDVPSDMHATFSTSGQRTSICFQSAKILYTYNSYPFDIGFTLYGFPTGRQRGSNYYTHLVPGDGTRVFPEVTYSSIMPMTEQRAKYEAYGVLSKEVMQKLIYPVRTKKQAYYVNISSDSGKHLHKLVEKYDLAGLRKAFDDNKDIKTGQTMITEKDRNYLISCIDRDRKKLGFHKTFTAGFNKLGTKSGMGFVPWTEMGKFVQNQGFVPYTDEAFECVAQVQFKFSIHSP